jgi:dethiobiotin synthetase
MSLFVVGTDTGVGKTVVSALVLARYGTTADLSAPLLAYWKPVATGGRVDRDVDFIRSRLLGRASVLEEEYLFDPPVSPHLAALRAGVRIARARILGSWKRIAAVPGRSIVVEGAGGLLVPLARRLSIIDLVREFGVPALLVARTALGTINHTLLSLEALRSRGIEVAGVVLDGPRSPETRDAIELFGRVRVVAEVPPLGRGRRPSMESIIAAARRFDRKGRLQPYMKP